MADKYSTEDIVRFINDQMNDGERANFIRAVMLDPILAAEVETQKKLAKLVQIAAIKEKLNNVHEQFIVDESELAETNRKRYFRFRVSAIAAATAGVIIFLLFYRAGSSANEKIFARYYKDDIGLPSLMGAQTDAVDGAMVYYKSGDYQTAAARFDQLLAIRPQNDTAKYYDALCQVKLKNEIKGIQLLQSIPSSCAGSGIYIKAEWYTALILIHQDKLSEAVTILKKIEHAGPSYYQPNAIHLLADLQKNAKR